MKRIIKVISLSLLCSLLLLSIAACDDFLPCKLSAAEEGTAHRYTVYDCQGNVVFDHYTVEGGSETINSDGRITQIRIINTDGQKVSVQIPSCGWILSEVVPWPLPAP